jgi:hypothetical protein
MTTSKKIFKEFTEMEGAYKTTPLEKIEGLFRSQYQIIKMCEYYSDSKYLEANYGNRLGGTGRPVPFYNIVNYRVALAKTATDLDIKDIQIVSDNPNYQVHSMFLNREAYEWMKKKGFAKTLNTMGTTRPKYGGYLLKKTEVGGELDIDVVPWVNVITDQKNILGGVIAEKHPMTPVELQSKMKTWWDVKEVLANYKKLKTKDRPASIDVWEITGEITKAVLADALGEKSSDEDEYTYSMQRYFVAVLDGMKFLLHATELTGKMEDYYEYLPWEENGYGLGRGVIEDSEEAQVWVNDAVINESIAMALAGRVGVKTTSKKLGNNILEHDHGKIYELEEGRDMAAISFTPSALGQYQVQINKWNAQADNVSSSYNAMTGEQPPSGTPYSQTALLNQVASKPFDYKREEWGIHLTKIFEKWVIPHLIKKIKREHLLVTDFTQAELEVIDESFATYQANQDIKKELLMGNMVSPIQQKDLTNGYKSLLGKTGKKRFIKIPDNYFDDIECKVSVITTGEQKNKAMVLQSLNQILETVQKSYNPQTGQFGVLTDPTLSRVFKDIIEMIGSGVSPVSLGKAPTSVAPASAPTQSMPVPDEVGRPQALSPM